MTEFVRKCRIVRDAEKVGSSCDEVVYRHLSRCWFLIANNMHVNYSLRNVGVHKMAVSMVSVVR